MLMNPTTEIDPRFSDPDATPTSWAEAEAVLASAQLSWLTTVRADGRPHTTPLVTVWHDGVLYFCTGAEEQKGVNLTHNAQVTVTTGCNTWDQGVDVVVEGEAVRVSDEALLGQLAEAWAQKWDGSWQFRVADSRFRHSGDEGVAEVFGVTPTKVLSFGKGPFSHTRHVF
jgi:general stress protein 26